MIVIHVEFANSGINKFPIEISFLNVKNDKSGTFLIKPIEFWEDDEECPKTTYPTVEDAFINGKDCAYVCKNLNDNLVSRKVYAIDAIETIDLLDMLYASCGDTPSYDVESLSTVISNDEFMRYEKFIIGLQYRCLHPLDICKELKTFLHTR